MIEDNEYVDEDGNHFYLDENGDPDFDDPVIYLSEYLVGMGLSYDNANMIQSHIVNNLGE